MLLQRIARAWKAIQVELHGRYSIARLRELTKYQASTSPWRIVATAFTMPVPCLLFVIFVDALPMRPISVSFHHQTFGFWFRGFAITWIMTFMVVEHVAQVIPALRMHRVRGMAISVTVGLVLDGVASLIWKLIGYPAPFLIQILTPPWLVLMGTLLWFSWRPVLRRDASARHHLLRYLVVFNSQCVIILTYCSYNAIFSLLSGFHQTLWSMVLPPLKLVFRNWVKYGLRESTDIAPTMIIFNVDVFHAMFVSLTMQQATSRGSIAVIVSVDLFQILISLSEVKQLFLEIRRLATKSKTIKVSKMRTAFAEYTLTLLEANGNVCRQLEKADKGSVRQSTRTRLSLIKKLSRKALSLKKQPSKYIIDTAAGEAPRVSPLEPRINQPSSDHSLLCESEILDAKILRRMLKLLRMVEFYILIEFVEVIMAIVYSTYLLVLSFLDNRVYYMQFRDLSAAQLRSTAASVAEYAALEMLSFLLLYAALRVRMPGLSPLKQLGFVLNRHMYMAHTTLVMWVFFVAQIPLVHLGSDFTFRFDWSNKAAPHT